MFNLLLAVTAKTVFTNIGYVLLALFALMLMIIIHECGHYLAGKLLGFKIDEFAIGMGPKIFKHTNKKTGELFSIRCLPVGGFCGFHGEDEEGGNDPLAFNNQKPWKRLIVLFSGAFFNFLSAILIITIFFSVYGQILPTVTDVYETGRAYAEGTFQKGDIIISVNGNPVNILLEEDLANFLKDAGDSAKIRVLRRTVNERGKTKFEVVKFTATKGDYSYEAKIYDEEGNDTGATETKTSYGFGIQRGAEQVKLPFFRAAGRAIPFCFFVVFKILASLGALITGKMALSSAGGTITAIRTISEVSKAGFSSFMYVLCILSANLAVMNLLPFPALDGSRMVFTLIEMIFKKPVPRKVEAVIHLVGFIILIGLTVFLDIFNLIKN
ncbi:MAG: M50 family metallopeptidase [Christensenellales bacterium]|jgi:regulator of sigma E protease